jgi:predicted acyltransferase
VSSTIPISGSQQKPALARTAPASTRLLSLDVFRGATIAAMILVNNAGDEPSSYWPLKHAEWNGWTPTDLIFPFFLFIVGVAMVFSLDSRLKRGDTRQRLLQHILWRGAILFALGMFLNGFPNQYHLTSWRVYGVLQRIAICYVITAMLALWTHRRGWITAVVVCLAGYWLLMRFVPVPGFGLPGRDVLFLDPDRNLAAWLDRKLLMGHLYNTTRDPEGVISTIPALATSLLGLLTGNWLRSAHAAKTKAAGMVLSGILAVALGEILNIWFPINKNLWTPSFVILTAGVALICLAVCYWIVDVQQWRGFWTVPFMVFGKNAIAAYVFAEVISHCLDKMQAGPGLSWQDVIYQSCFEPLASPANASLLYAICCVAMCFLAMWLLYRKGIFLKV